MSKAMVICELITDTLQRKQIKIQQEKQILEL